MATTRKRRRSTKHRGNAAGVVETRGRTGRRPTDEERGSSGAKGGKPVDRRDRPPSWQSATQRAIIAVVLFVVLVVLLFKQPVPSALGLGAFMLLIYIPLGYYTDMWMYRRRQAKQLTGSKG